MSRYTIESTKPEIEIVVGWDRPLGSLFAQVSDRTITDEESDPMLLWEDFSSTDELARAIAPWAELPDDVRLQLAIESGEKPAARTPTFERPERVVFSGSRCRIVQGLYPHGSIYLALLTDDAGRSQLAVATVCLPGSRLAANEASLKTYSENEGMLEALVDAGIIRTTGRFVASGYVRIPIVEVLPKVPVDTSAPRTTRDSPDRLFFDTRRPITADTYFRAGVSPLFLLADQPRRHDDCPSFSTAQDAPSRSRKPRA